MRRSKRSWESQPATAGKIRREPEDRLRSEQEIDFAELKDGTLVEMIEDPANSTKSLLAVYNNGVLRYTDKLRDGNRVLIPLSRTDPVSKHVCLPQGAEPYGGLEKLLAEVAGFPYSCLDVELGGRMLMTAHVLSSWLPEKLPFAPYLALVGPPGSGKTTALRILTLLCRRSLPTSDITSAAFYDVCHRMHPTILIDETRTAAHPRTLFHLLRSSSSRGFVALRKDKAQLAYGPKVLSWIELPNDAALNSRCIILPMHRTARTDLKSPDDPNVLQIAAKVRMHLQQFRFEHYHSVSVPRIPADIQLSSRALDLYRALALPVGEDQKFCKALAHLIAAQRQFQGGLLSPTQASAVRVLFIFIHMAPTSSGSSLNAVTTAMNSDLALRGEPCGLNERKTGDILTSLGLTNRTRKNAGYFLWLERMDRERIHQLACDYEVDGVSTEPDPNRPCDLCIKMTPAGPSSGAAGVPAANQIRSKRPKRERREHREHHSRGETRSTVRSINRLRYPKS